MGTQLATKRAQPVHTIFSHVRCGQTAGWIKMPLDTEVGHGPGHIVFDGDPAPLKKGTAALQFSTHVCCGQTTGWIQMSLGMELGLGPGHTVLDGNPAPNFWPMSPQIFGPYLLWPNGWMDPCATWYGGRPRPRRHC